MLQSSFEDLTPLDGPRDEYTFSVAKPQEAFADDSLVHFPYIADTHNTSEETWLGQTFDYDVILTSSAPCSTVGGLSVSLTVSDCDSNSSCGELSTSSPQSGNFLELPSTRAFTGRRKSDSSAGIPISSVEFLSDLRRRPSAPSLNSRYEQQISHSARKMSLEIETTNIFATPELIQGSSSDSRSPIFTDGPSSYGNTTPLISGQTQVTDGLPFWLTPTPSPISLNCPLLPVDGTSSSKSHPQMGKSRSKKDMEASRQRRKMQGPGKYVCKVCGDDFTTKHRLQGHQESKHDGIKFRCNACNVELSHRTSYDRHAKKTCPVLHPRDTKAGGT